MEVNIQNTEPRLDVDGSVIDAHDGCLRYFECRYYLYGTRYRSTDGFTEANCFVCYSSPDLTRWTFHGELLVTPMRGVCYRPYVVWNLDTQKYVLWFNWYPKLWEGQFAVGMSSSPNGPFEIVNANAEVVQPAPGDHNLYVDDDGRAYLIYTSIEGDGSGHHGISVERLNHAYTESTRENGGVFDTGVEAPVIIKANGIYRAFFGNTCCFCPEGAGLRVYRTIDLMGTWEFEGELNVSSDGGLTVPGQQTDIAVLPTAGGPTYLWMADLWGSRRDGVKGHDLQHWESLSFDADGRPMPLQGLPSFDVNLDDHPTTFRPLNHI